MGVENTLELLAEVPGLKLVFDTGNPSLTPDFSRPRPWPNQDALKSWTALRDHVAHIHVKDGWRDPESGAETYIFPGEGPSHVREILADCLARGYSGWLTIEPHMAVVYHDPTVGASADRRRSVFVEYGRRLEALLTALGREVRDGAVLPVPAARASDIDSGHEPCGKGVTMANAPRTSFKDEEELEAFLSAPSARLVDAFRSYPGDIVLLGVAGKIGVTLGRMAVRAVREAGTGSRMLGVSRFSDRSAREKLERAGVECLVCDLLDRDAVDALPDADRVLFLAGKKFGTSGSEEATWAMNTVVPAYVARRYRRSSIVAYSTGCVYDFVTPYTGGSAEGTLPGPWETTPNRP